MIRLSKALNEFDYSKCAANGADLRFADSNGNLIPHEIDTWVENGESLVWVKVPSLTKETMIKVYYGCKVGVTPPAVTASDVWTNGYVAVWHMGVDDGSYTQNDSTTNGLTLTSLEGENDGVTFRSGVEVGAVGKIGKAVAFDKNDKHYGSFYVDDAHDVLDGFGAFTLEAWTCQNDHDPTQAVQRTIFIRNRPGNNGVNVYKLYEAANTGKHAFFYKMENTSDVTWISVGSSTAPNRGEWRYSARCWDGATGNIRGFEDDIRFANATSDSYKGSMISAGGRLTIGNEHPDQYGNAAFPGTIDEVRVSNVARSDAWVNASYDTVHDVDFAVFEKPNDWSMYSHRFSVSFTPSDGLSALTDFPVLVKIAEYDVSAGTGIVGFDYDDFLKVNGVDLHFADENGNMLSSEVDTWNPSGESLVWVKIPNLTTGTKITAYYGWLFAPGQDSAGVWDENYLGVWHMNTAAGGLKQYDSTAYGKNVSCPGEYASSIRCGVDGVVGGAAQFGLTEDNYGGFAVPDPNNHFDGHGAFTMEAWTYTDSAVGIPTDVNRDIIHKMRAFGTWDYCFSMYVLPNNGKIQFYIYMDGSGFVWPGQPAAPTMDEWHYNVRTWDGATGAYSMIQDTSTINGTAATGQMKRNDGDFCIGNQSANSNGKNAFPGSIDEVRVSKVARSADWVKATYDTIMNNADFTTYGPVKENGRTGLIIMLR